MQAHPSGLEASQEAMTEYRVLGPMINGCSWIELRPLTSRKHQVKFVSHSYDNCSVFRPRISMYGGWSKALVQLIDLAA